MVRNVEDYNISILYYTGNANIVADALSRITIGSVSHIYKSKNDLWRYLHGLATLGVRSKDPSDGGFVVCHNSE